MDRHECKYVLSETQAREFLDTISPRLTLDAHARAGARGYEVASLYLDTPKLRLHREKMEGIRNRFKLRIRRYDLRSESPVWLEIKRRRDGIVSKTRSLLPQALLPRLLDHEDLQLLVEPAQREAHAQFAHLLLRLHARPTMWVRYQREAYADAFDPTLRVTVDRRLQCLASDALDPGMAGWTDVEGRRVIVELKFNDRCPAWLSTAIRCHGLQRTSFSKYSTCVLSASERGQLLTEAANLAS